MVSPGPAALKAYENKGLAIKHAVFWAVLAALLVAAPAFGAAGSGGPSPVRGAQLASPSQHVPGEVLVVFRAGASRGAMARAHLRADARVTERFPGFRIQLVKVSQGISVHQAIRAYERDPAVVSAEPNYLRHLTANPLDKLFANQWDLDNVGQLHDVTRPQGAPPPADHAGLADADIDAPEAWAIEDGSSHETTIAVIDTGVDVTQPDLDGQLWVNPGEDCPGCQTDTVDNDLNGKVDDVHGWHFTSTTNGDADLLPAPFTDYEHGTHVAGTIAAELNDTGSNDGIVGVCPGCKIMVLRIATDSGDMPIGAEIKALAYAKSKGAKIANMSLGGPEWSNAEREALRTSGLLAVVAAGNESLDNDMSLVDSGTGASSPSYPASYTLNNIIAVGASNDRDENAYSTECRALGGTKPQCAFTNWGHDSVDVSAPGVDITSSVPGANWETWDGTSMAAPHVAGIAGLVLSRHPGYSVAQMKNAIMHGVDKPTRLKTMFFAAAGVAKTGNFTRTSGRVNANKALTAGTSNATPLTDGNINGARSMTTATVSGSVAWPADINDVRKRRLAGGHTYRITLVVPSRKDYDLFVWKPGTKEIWQPKRVKAVSAHGNGVDEVVRIRVGATGTFYIHVSAWLFKSGSYTLKIKRVS
jgi:subtilisin family serine protease